MPPDLEPLNPQTWHRGRSRRRSFPGLRAEHVADLVSRLPVELGPYEVYAHELVGQGRNHRSVFTKVEARQVPEVRERGVWQFFLVSKSLSRAVLDRVETCELADFAINGAIGLQVGVPPRNDGIDITFTLTAVRDDEVVEHREYERVYRAVVAGARRVAV